MKQAVNNKKNARFRFGLVVSTYHGDYTQALRRSAERELLGHRFDVVEVPGAFEIPLQVQRLAQKKEYDAILAFGLVWQGETMHAGEILRACTDGLMRVSLDTGVPVIHEVLSVKTAAEAKARCMGKRLNRGTEAARAALAVARLR